MIVHISSVMPDLDFVQKRLLRALPSLGFDHWSSSPYRGRAETIRQTAPPGEVTLVVVSSAAAKSTWFRIDVERALEGDRPVIPILIDDTKPDQVAQGLGARPFVDFRQPFPEAYRNLARLLPARDATRSQEAETRPGRQVETGEITMIQPLEWDAKVFSEALAAALERRDNNAAEELIDNLGLHCSNRSAQYPSKHAVQDLKILKRYRVFGLMRKLGSSVLKTGTSARGTVKRLLSQALIEQSQFDEALGLLGQIVADRDADPEEIDEAKGLAGRVFKQLYVDQPSAPDASALIRSAIDAYSEVYLGNFQRTWHGINAASCIIRANRDGHRFADLSQARAFAERILATLESNEQGNRLDLWDLATRVEALAALERFDEAMDALGMYLGHPAFQATGSVYPYFEVASTYRQFHQVLQLDKSREGLPLVSRLWSEVERYRSQGTMDSDPVGPFQSHSSKVKPLVIRVGDARWQPRDVPDIEITARLGTIIAASGTHATVDALLRDMEVISVEESYPAGTSECDASVPFIKATEVWNSTGERGAGALVAVIDNGIDVLHEAFLGDDGQSRILEIWDQNGDGSPPDGFKYGTLHTAEKIAGYLSSGVVPVRLGRNLQGHGTHVASIAAGRPAGSFSGGVAPAAKIVVVISQPRGPLGYSNSHIQALDYLDDLAERLDLPIVVKISQGMNAGAHDGKSALEIAFNEFSKGGRKKGRVIVKSAGNERGKLGHAKITVASDTVETLTWRRRNRQDSNWPRLNSTDRDRMELWWNSANTLKMQLVDPSGEESPQVSENQTVEGRFASGDQYKMQYTRRHIDNGDSRLLIEIEANSGAQVRPGIWTLRIESGVVKERGDIHAWVERERWKLVTFQDHIAEEMTLSIPGTAENVISVAAIKPGRCVAVGSFSSYGPTRDCRPKPEVAAPGVEIKAARGGTADRISAKSGTSMAAPHVTGAIALLLSKKPELTANEIAAALRQKTRNYSGLWDRAQGWGVIDVSALLDSF